METAIANGDGVNVFLFFQMLEKVAKKYTKQTKELAVDFWLANKEMPHGFSVKESNRKSYEFKQDPRWQALKAELDAREEVLKAAAESSHDYYDTYGELTPKVPIKNTAIYSFTQK